MQGCLTILKRGRLITPNPPCPKCGSFMYMPREKGTVHFDLCRSCGFMGLKKDFSWEAIKFYFRKTIKFYFGRKNHGQRKETKQEEFKKPT